MPELDDLGSLVPLAGANLSSLDKIPVYHAASRSVRQVSATDIGSGTPPTTESTLALLAGADLEVASIGLSDGTGASLDLGRLTLNANNDPVVHDGDSNTEDLPYLINSRESIAFSTEVLAASMDNQPFSRKLFDIPLPASALTNNKRLFMSGRIFSLWEAGAKPDAGAFLVFCKEGQDPLADGILFTIATATTSEEISFSIPWFFSVVSTTWTLELLTGRTSGIARKNASGTITHESCFEDTVDINLGSGLAVTGTAGQPAKIECWLVTSDSSDAVTAKLFVSGNLSAISE